MAFLLSDAQASRRILPFVVVDITTGLPSSAAITNANVQLHQHGGSWVNATNNPVALTGQPGAWTLQLTQAEVSVAGLLGWRVTDGDVAIRTEVSWELVSTAEPVPDYAPSEINAALATLPIFVVGDTSGTPSAITIDHTNIQIFKPGGSWTNVTNDPTAVTGQTGAWELDLRPDLNVVGLTAWRVVKTGIRTQIGFYYVGTPTPIVAGPTGFGGIATGETDPTAAEVAFNLPSIANPSVPVTGYAFTTGEVQILLPGQTWVNVSPTQIVEKGYGRYCVRLTAAQCALAGSVFIRVNVATAQPYFGYDRIGVFAGDIPQGLGGALVFYLPNASDPVYGAPLTGHVFAAGEVRVCLPGGVYTDAVVNNIVEIGYGSYALNLTAAQTTNRGKVFIYANVSGAQVFEGYETISSTNVSTSTSTGGGTVVVPVTSPVAPTSPTYVDHITIAVNRLPQQFR